ncbi:hypothetical protein FNV43_RR06064 [Rhamnella rubrinervis]|uniref:Uncharacterized protein n=1 Tax=Rhamnella rubrinervis TaxID=2594499 RepID=A0A8K0HDS8_9ROSA|nr:hypothetical protein FNV43_RR06064 [Rhamnella rubrinervis]
MAIDPNSTATTTLSSPTSTVSVAISGTGAVPGTTPSIATTPTPSTAANSARQFTNPSPSRPVSPLNHPHPHLLHHHQQLTPFAQHHQPLYTAQALPIRSPNPNFQLAKPPHDPSSSPAQGIPYPVASSGRGFIRHLPVSDQTVTVANPGGGYPPRPLVNFPHGGVRTHLESLSHAATHAMRPPPYNLQQQHHHYLQRPHLASTGGLVKGVPVSASLKVAPPSSVPYSNGYKDMRDKGRDDNLAVIRHRNVRITEGASLYALCRSWLKDGVAEESQPQYGDAMRSLPKPSPIHMKNADLSKKKEAEDDGDEEVEDEESVEHLSSQDLLKRHIKRAKKVRSRLREERLKRIARYKSRLALLLPPLVEQQFRNDAAAGT